MILLTLKLLGDKLWVIGIAKLAAVESGEWESLETRDIVRRIS